MGAVKYGTYQTGNSIVRRSKGYSSMNVFDPKSDTRDQKISDDSFAGEIPHGPRRRWTESLPAGTRSRTGIQDQR